MTIDPTDTAGSGQQDRVTDSAAWLNGGTIVEAHPFPHPCRTPKPRHMRKHGYAHGTTWRCECGQLWKLTGYAEDEFWTRITEGKGGLTVG